MVFKDGYLKRHLTNASFCLVFFQPFKEEIPTGLVDKSESFLRRI